ncbi:lysyl-tRNA synthetase, class 2 [Terrimicrobium sacchariphilum]|uniref:Lysine--tRNA ligase n=1 Tax=Terrimicrobium sacchariphilum TaxID=690879 RepID=A0A146G5Q0_TERSA|nr:lysine--tRNA ligase [Terrimicrobium sacchariphilum]GAT33085.1 lysyl-tRNA synthetase, class 2 [Terrimicrobium sacchariphilum]
MEPISDLLAVRRQKLDALRAKGVRPFGGRFPTDGSISDVRNAFAEGKTVRAAGRITAHRDMGKSRFLDLSDITGRMQLFLHAKEIGEDAFATFQQLDIGDWMGVEGEYFTTKTGEPSIRVKTLTVLSKALRPLPDKWHGVQDAEIKYRQRYLDLISNPESREVFLQRIAIVREIRRFLDERGFLEVETPMMQAVAGGAAAAPFKTHHNALSMDLFLRIAPELYLKRLLVGGFPKVFELNRNFRNEGISRRHNPEFTMLEVYWAFSDFESMSELVEEMICHLAQSVRGTLQIEHKDAEGNVTKTIDLSRPWKRARYSDLIKGVVPEWYELSSEAKRAKCVELGLDIQHCTEDFELTQHVFEKLVEEKSINPLFVTHCPKELVPLANQNAEDDSVVDVYELVINGQEISPGYSELNDPDIQRQRLEHQSGGETQKLDEDFLGALEYGMPPAGGVGIGIDRLVMMLTGAESIRDVILFPHMRVRES